MDGEPGSIGVRDKAPLGGRMKPRLTLCKLKRKNTVTIDLCIVPYPSVCFPLCTFISIYPYVVPIIYITVQFYLPPCRVELTVSFRTWFSDS